AAAKAKAAALATQKAKQAEGAGNESTDDLALAKQKAVAAAKAKAAALAKQKAKQAEGTVNESADDLALAKQKAVAAAKAKAAALAKQKAKTEGAPADDLAKQKAAAVAKAKAAAAAKAKASRENLSDDELAKEKAKAIAAAKAKAAAAAKAKKLTPDEQPQQEEPSPNEPILNKYVKVIGEQLGKDVLEESYINRLSKDVPTLVAKKESYFAIAKFLKEHEELSFDYVSELHGTDFQTHMEMYVYLFSYVHRHTVVLKVKLDRDKPEIDSLEPLWKGADWPEREAFDLLGIHFAGHPNLTRIMMPDDWVGHPLRKDYEPYDVEV
ncbi:NADH dehydrogenase, partial [Bacillus sp. HMSC76G11]